MNRQLYAHSISRPAEALLQAGEAGSRRPLGQVWASFRQACDVVTLQGDVIVLVAPQVGNGPLNVVLSREPAGWPAAGTPVYVAGTHLQAGPLEIALAGATTWEPCPNWERLRAQWPAIAAQLVRVGNSARQLAPEKSLLKLIPTQALEAACTQNALEFALISQLQEARAMLGAAWTGDLGIAQAGAALLAGLGGGLTPAGDDWLCGLMLRAWLAHPSPQAFCLSLAEVAAPRTTVLSAAFLRAAAAGQCSAPWHSMLAALSAGDEQAWQSALCSILAHGATSGADTLAGFLEEVD